MRAGLRPGTDRCLHLLSVSTAASELEGVYGMSRAKNMALSALSVEFVFMDEV
jgi:hypothetical protein